MAFSHFLYQLLIGPLELFLEVAYVFINKYLFNSALSIIALSLIVNTLLLPMHKRADMIQDEERTLENSLSHWVKHIKKTFHGDERTMILQTYYRQNGYKPYYALKASLPLVLIIPFFIAAYHFLSNLQELNGMRFGPIMDLGAPDRLLYVSGYTINVLPIIMTVINCISSAIYSKDFTLKEKIQLYGMALIFLILLYDSPSGLVLYWTTNNIFSLGKNLFKKHKIFRWILNFALAFFGTFTILFGLFRFHPENTLLKVLFLLFGMFLYYPLINTLLKGKLQIRIPTGGNTDNRIFTGGCIFAALLTGVLIPSAVIVSSPAEFVLIKDFYSPVRHVLNAALISTGFFVIWLGVFYYLSDEKKKSLFSLLIWLFSGVAVIDYMFFGTTQGTLSEELKYFDGMSFTSSEKLINAAVIAALVIVLLIIFLKKRTIIQTVFLILTISVAGMSAINIVNIQRNLPEIRHAIENAPEENARLTLSKNGQNVIVFMLDRAISSYLPYLFQENPELERQFEGFTYYPNTVSFGPYTNFGAPALFGGYEYTPEELNRRSEETLETKHNEALKVMPVLFDEAGYEVTVCDPVYAGYSWIPDLSIYDDYPNIRAYVTEHGQFNLLSNEEQIKKTNHIWERNFFCYSIMKICPVFVQKSVYYNGTYLEAAPLSQTIYDLSNATGMNSRFINSYSVLCALTEITEVSENSSKTFLMMDNSTTHEPAMLSEPEYEPADIIDNTEFDRENRTRFIYEDKEMKVTNTIQMTHYQTNMAALIQLGKWMDFLRENNVYDNTRIIIAADHGRNLNQFEDMKFGDRRYEDVMYFNPLLLVKDFGSTESATSYEYMTNADVPTLAMKDIIENPVNPFTGKNINSDPKYNAEQHIFYSTYWQPMQNNGNTFKPGKWYSVHDDIFDMNNWSYLGED